MSRTQHRRSHRLAIVPASAVALVLGAAAPAPLPAQTTSILEEITVTAQRREEQLQDIPLAVTAFNSSQLETLQVDQALDMGRLVPNLVAHNNTGLGTANAYSLRGLNNTESISTFDPPVGSYVDDIYVARQNANNFTLFDVDRIEVLRGPQGTLFGRNTTGGAVRVILKKPAEEMGGYLELGAGEYDRYVARGSIDVPVSDNFLTKFSAFWIDDDGFVENRTTGDTLNGEENFGVRAAFLWRIADGLEWDLSVDYEDTSDANVTYNIVGDERVSLTGLSESGTPLAGFFTGKKRNFNFGNDVEAFNVTSNLDWDVGGGTLSFIAGYRDLQQEFALDFLDGNAANRAAFGQPPAPYGGFSISNDGEHEQVTLELKYTGNVTDNISYVAGVFYLDEENKVDFGDVFDFDLGFTVFPFAPIGDYIALPLADRVLENNTESWAAYLQTDIRFLEAWTLTLGVRYTDESKDVSFKDNQPCQAGDLSCFVDDNLDGISDNDLSNVNLALFGIGRDLDTDLWTPRIALQYEFNPEVNVYASATRGFKSGGWNARGTTPDQLQPFDAEVVWSYELGLRSTWLDNRLRANITAFYLDVSDFQLPTAFQPISGQVQFITRNFAGLKNKGIEMELIAQPIEPLTLLATVGFQDAEYQDLAPEILQQQQDCRDGVTSACNAGIIDPNGNIADPTRTPDYTLTLGAIYRHDLGNGFELTPSAYLYRVGDHNVFSSGSPDFLVDGYSTFNAALELRDTDDNWGVVVECKNCNDRTMLVSGLAGQPYYQDPRTWMVRFRKDFGN
jgi:iron complex outermembrane receptor protein